MSTRFSAPSSRPVSSPPVTTRSAAATTAGGNQAAPAPSPRGERAPSDSLEPKWAAAIDRATD